MTKQELQQQLKEAMLAKNTVKTSVLRMLLSAVGYMEIQKGAELSETERARLLDKGGRAGYEATEEDITAVVQKEVKQRKDSIEQYQAAGREELAAKEKEEITILQNYLPEQMSEEEIKQLVQNAVQQTGATSMQDMGKVMGMLMPKIKGKADGSVVSKCVKEALTS